MALPNPRVVITSNNTDGKPVFATDQTVQAFSPFGPAASSFFNLDAQPAVPVSNQHPAGQNLPGGIPRCGPAGLLFAVCNYPPNYSVPMHRTLSLDYCIVISGEIVLVLEGGDERTIKAGEFIIQGGVNHSWINRTDEVCRVAFVTVGAEKVKLPSGEVLDEIMPKKPGN